MHEWNWQPDERPPTASVDLCLDVAHRTTGWQTALARAPKITVLPMSLLDRTPRVISIPIGRTAIKTHGFTFPDAPSWLDSSALAPRKTPVVPAASTSDVSPPPARRTRIKPPGDIVKLADRLYYLLQPPLELLLASGSLSLPLTPFPFQMEGIAYLYSRHAAILADEMGLGKTMQAITTIRLLLRAGELRRVLLICPKPLVTNWQREFSLWAPEVPLAIVQGNRQTRQWQWKLPEAAVKIANYELLVRDQDLLDDPAMHFDLVVLDEAQRIKNRAGATNQVVRSIRRTRNWALTGTPVENSPEDLVGIFEFLAPGYLREGMNPRRLGRAAGDYILRRTKDMVLRDLPPKLYRDADLDLTPEQRHTYQLAKEEGVLRLTEMDDGLSIQHVFELVLRLKQICNFDPVTGASSKLQRLVADLEEVAASGKKAIVFSQWVQTLTTLRKQLARFGPLEYHGKIPSRQREGVIERFRKQPEHQVILMSYGAGGVGLNLQFCHYVFLFDRWWNPAVEDQAINRAHRIGVTGPVTVSRFLTLDTIEERIDDILQQKRELFNAILSHTHTPNKLGLSRQEIFGLLDLEPPQATSEAA